MTRQLRLALVSLVGLFPAVGVAAGTVQVSSDPFTNASSQHMTEVEPQIFANGSTIAAVFQQGRIFGGGSSHIGFSTSLDGGPPSQAGSPPALPPSSARTPFPAPTHPSPPSTPP